VEGLFGGRKWKMVGGSGRWWEEVEDGGRKWKMVGVNSVRQALFKLSQEPKKKVNAKKTTTTKANRASQNPTNPNAPKEKNELCLFVSIYLLPPPDSIIMTWAESNDIFPSVSLYC
jgi:hypothetical protein